MNCRRKFNLIAARPQANQAPDDFFVPSPLSLASNSVGLQRISCNSGVAVPLRLLAVEEIVNCDADVCEYNSPCYFNNECRFDHSQFAYLYVGARIANASIKHYVIAFVESTKIGRYDELIQILDRTIRWLRIENEGHYFYIYYHGRQPVFNTGLIDARNNIVRELKSRLTGYKEGERFCMTMPVGTNTLDFTIFDTDPYKFNVS